MANNNDEVMSPGEVAIELGVDPKTVTRWAQQGIIPFFTLPKGHRRFYRADVEAIKNGAR